jgi:hypothetical protein
VKRRRFRGQSETTVTLTLEIDVEVDCAATPGNPGRLYGPPEKCYPPEPGEVEILAIRSAQGATLDIESELSRADVERIEEAALEALGDSGPDEDDLYERHRDRMMEDR